MCSSIFSNEVDWSNMTDFKWKSGNLKNCCFIRCHLLRLKCTKFDFSWGSAPDPLAGFVGAYFLRGGRKGGKPVIKQRGIERRGRGRKVEWRRGM